MTLDVRDQVRRYVEHVDSISKSIDIDSILEPTTQLRPQRRPVRRTPGWVYGLAAAALILLLVGGGLLLFLPDDDAPPADISPAPEPTLAPEITAPPPPPTIAAPIPPVQLIPTPLVVSAPEPPPPPEEVIPRNGCSEDYTAWLAARARECDLVEGQVVSPVSGPLLDGGWFDMRDWGGRPAVVFTWVDSYGPGNRSALADLQVLHERWAGRVNFLAISEDVESVTRQAVARTGVTVPVVSCFADQPLEDGSNLLCGTTAEQTLWVWWGNQDLPSWVVLDSGTRFVDIRLGASTPLEEIDALITSVAAPPPMQPDSATDSTQFQTRIVGDSVVLTSTSGGGRAIGVPEDDRPVIAFVDEEPGLVVVAKCLDPECTTAILTPVAAGIQPDLAKLAIGPAGDPIVAHRDWIGDRSPVYLQICHDAACGESTRVEVGGGNGEPPLVKLGPEGHPVVAYTDGETGVPTLVMCEDALCQSYARSALPGTGWAAWAIALEVRDDGRPIVAAIEDGRLVFYSCDDVRCESVSTSLTSTAATGGTTGLGFDMALDGDGLPAVVFEVGRNLLLYARCQDADCSAIGATTNVLAPGVGMEGDEGFSGSLVFDGDGVPVISFVARAAAGRTLHVARCADISCTGELEIVSYSGCVLPFASTAVDASGSPVVVYQMNPWERDGTIRLLNIDVATESNAGAASVGCD